MYQQRKFGIQNLKNQYLQQLQANEIGKNQQTGKGFYAGNYKLFMKLIKEDLNDSEAYCGLEDSTQ